MKFDINEINDNVKPLLVKSEQIISDASNDLDNVFKKLPRDFYARYILEEAITRISYAQETITPLITWVTKITGEFEEVERKNQNIINSITSSISNLNASLTYNTATSNGTSANVKNSTTKTNTKTSSGTSANVKNSTTTNTKTSNGTSANVKNTTTTTNTKTSNKTNVNGVKNIKTATTNTNTKTSNKTKINGTKNSTSTRVLTSKKSNKSSITQKTKNFGTRESERNYKTSKATAAVVTKNGVRYMIKGTAKTITPKERENLEKARKKTASYVGKEYKSEVGKWQKPFRATKTGSRIIEKSTYISSISNYNTKKLEVLNSAAKIPEKTRISYKFNKEQIEKNHRM